MTTVVDGKPLVTSLVALVSASHSMVTITTGPTMRTTSATWDSRRMPSGYRGITALDGEGKVTVIRPGDYDADECMRWEEGDDE